MGGGVRAEEGWACRGELRAGGPRDATDWRRAAGEVEEAVSGKRRADPARDAETGAEGEADYEIPAERLPPGFVDTLEAPPKRPAVAVAAATVVVMREGDDGPEVLLLRRNRATGFVPGAYVFPGGRVDRADGDEKLARRWDSLTAAGATARLGLAADADPPAIAYYAAAIREAAEETGLWPGVRVGGEVTDEDLRDARENLMRGVSFSRVLEELDARLHGPAIEYIAHWVTPVVEPRRYDTRFFAARVPRRARAIHDEREMTDSVWLTPPAALARHRCGHLPMIFPTIRTLEDLCGFATVETLLAHYRNRPVRRVRPAIVRTPTGVALRVGRNA